MRPAALLLLGCACAAATWTIPQRHFTTVEPGDAWRRMLAATQDVCGGLGSMNEAAGVVTGPWQAWNTGDGLYLSQCLVSLLDGDEQVRAVRVSFAIRRCPLSDQADLDALAPTCAPAELVPELVKNATELEAGKLQAAIRVEPR